MSARVAQDAGEASTSEQARFDSLKRVWMSQTRKSVRDGLSILSRRRCRRRAQRPRRPALQRVQGSPDNLLVEAQEYSGRLRAGVGVPRAFSSSLLRLTTTPRTLQAPTHGLSGAWWS